MHKTITVLVVVTALIGLAGTAQAGLFLSPDQKRQKVDLVADQTLERLFAVDAKAKRLYERAMGYAVFNVTKGAFLITGSGGTGVAVDKLRAHRTYMHTGSGGVGLGIGGQAYRLVVLFEDDATFDNFVQRGWQASSTASAVAGRTGYNAEASFTNGLAVFQVTDAGLLLVADITGTRFWPSKRLNRAYALRSAQREGPATPQF